MEQIYRIADHTILIRTMYERMHREAADYAASGCVDFTIETTQTDIDAERAQSVRTDAAEGRTATAYSDAYLETLAVYRKIAERMPDDGTVLFHGSAIAVDGAAYLFTAKSGTGKSTHARFWRETFGERCAMINDDKPMLRVSDEGVTVYGTPWNGKHHLGGNISAPLKAIISLSRSDANSIAPLPASEAFPVLLSQVYASRSAATMRRIIGLEQRIVNGVRFYKLGCNLDPEAALVAYSGIKEDLNR